MRVADYIAKRLRGLDIDPVFMVTGRGILFLTDAFAKEKLNCIPLYHEQGAAYAAMSFAQAKGKISVCLVSTGCAATNAITPLLCAWQDNIPMLIISGQHILKETKAYTGVPVRTYGSQETDIVSIVKPITKYAKMIDNPKKIKFEFEKAIYLANKGRKGPVWIDIPLDIQNARIDENELFSFDATPIPEIMPDTEANIVICEISEAKRPVLLVGGGVRGGEAINELRLFAERIKLPVVFTPSACDAYGAANGLSIGAIGAIGGSRAGNFALQNADYILAIGSRLCSQTTGEDFEKFAPNAKITIVDIDPVEHTKSEVHIDRLILSDSKDFLRSLLSFELPVAKKEWQDKCLHWKNLFSISNEAFVKRHKANNNIDLYSFSDFISEHLPDDATIITDAGFEELIIPAAIRFKDGQRCLFPAAQGAMGYAIPAIAGAHFAGRKNITAIVGDGSIMMNLQELQIMTYHHIPAKIFVINNGMYAIIRKRQQDLFRSRTIGTDPSNGVGMPDFKAVAKAFGFSYKKWETFNDMTNQGANDLQSGESFICEVICPENQEYLHQSYGLNEKHRLERRPLEDLSPFIDREILKSEMVRI